MFVTNAELEVTDFSPDMVMNRFITLHVAWCVYDIARTHVSNNNKSNSKCKYVASGRMHHAAC